jgi:hypothetical protein
MKKLAAFTALLVAGCLVAGVYGVLHDQISYTVSPEYFHRFKFIQFRIAPQWHNRVGAAKVGWMATWWMGAIIGLPVLGSGLLIRGVTAYVRHSLIAFGLVMLTAIVFGASALFVALATITPKHLPPYRFPDGVTNKVAFACVGAMHNFSYLGGFVGIFVGVAYLAWARWQQASIS